MEKIILILIAMIPITYQIVGLKDGNYNYIQYIPMLFLNIALMVYFYKRKVKLIKESLIVFLMLCMAVLIVPFVMSIISKTLFMENILYTMFYANFIVMILLLTNYMAGGKFKSTIGSLLVGNTIVLLINILKNRNDISIDKCIANISNILKFVDQKEILYLGFNHPNLVSMFIIIEMLLLYEYKKTVINIKIRICFDLIIILWIIPLLATGSRTAIVCSVIFFIVKVFFWFFLKIKTCWKIAIITIVIMLLCIILGNINFTKINLTESMSGRMTDVTSLFSYLNENKKLITGIGPTNSTLNYVHTWGIEGTPDNGYLAIIAQYGIIGFVLIMSALVYIFYINFNKKNSTNCGLIITFLIYSCVENVLFISRVWMCVLIWLFIVNFQQEENINGNDKKTIHMKDVN